MYQHRYTYGINLPLYILSSLAALRFKDYYKVAIFRFITF